MDVDKHTLSRRFASSLGEVAWDTAGEGPDLLLVHGTPTSSVIWRPVIERLKKHYRLTWLDLPGYGASQKFAGQEVRLRAFARVVREFCREAGLKRPHMVGHDFGAAAVLGAHLVEGQEVASLVVADGVVLNPWGTDFSLHVSRHEAVFAAVPEYVHLAQLRAHLATAVARPLDRETEAALLAPWSGQDGQAAYYRQVAQYDHAYTAQLEQLYPELKVPFLVLWGALDQWVDIAVGRRLQQMVPEAELRVLPDAGHFSMLDTPGLFSRELENWLQQGALA
ncbi:alpha/beta fold hydrolase [Fodinicurvata fenggangensis]|uniref:alpha/beta fold hydrolase n=1 Tax=Fodinicurvata fenggangensis TaxID=1121830 RepID=UPI0012DEB995|nr:alpha/beta hydrolase [Fodinicurvata fenggangensis]